MPHAMHASPPVVAGSAQPDVELKQVSKRFGSATALNPLNLTIEQGEFFSILGPSGCGKTTLLRLIAGFEQPSDGQVVIQGRAMGAIPPHRRPVNTVFQSYALFDHMSVADNVAFGLRIRRLKPAQIKKRVASALAMVKMSDFAQRRPPQLSGGQQQRVALARALVNRPAVMLLDEPLGALDLKLRKQMQVELSTLHRQLGITFIMVTHDQEEALSLSDRIAVMNHGQLEQVGTPSAIYDFPQTPFVADFIGDTNLISGQLDTTDAARLRVTTPSGLQVWLHGLPFPSATAGAPLVVSVRPEKIHLSPDPPAAAANCFLGHIAHVMYLGTHIHCLVQLQSGESLTVLQPNRTGVDLQADSPVYVHWATEDCLALAA